MNRIDYSLISQALSYYEQQGFRYVEVPWVVNPKALFLTLPEDRQGLWCGDGGLVGSAEQSFMHMIIYGQLQVGRYVAASPCFRDDPPDEWHQRTFFKVELIDIVEQPKGWGSELCDDVPSLPEREMAEIALSFFQRFEPECLITPNPKNPWPRSPSYNAPINPGPGFDITLGGVELGSYGCRGAYGFGWTYGTGLAEPRFSMAREALKR